jgi:hypothetical protein
MQMLKHAAHPIHLLLAIISTAGAVSAGLRRMSSLSLRCASPGLSNGWADMPQDCLVAIIDRFSSKNDAGVGNRLFVAVASRSVAC